VPRGGLAPCRRASAASVTALLIFHLSNRFRTSFPGWARLRTGYLAPQGRDREASTNLGLDFARGPQDEI